MRATIPANRGVAADVPPSTNGVPLALAKPLPSAQYVGMHIKYPSHCADAAKARSGTSRPFIGGKAAPVCQLGCGKFVLTPPPLAQPIVVHGVPDGLFHSDTRSFQATS